MCEIRRLLSAFLLATLVLCESAVAQSVSGVTVILGATSAIADGEVSIDISAASGQRLLARRIIKSEEDWKEVQQGLPLEFGYTVETAEIQAVIAGGGRWSGTAGLIANVVGGAGDILIGATSRPDAECCATLKPSGTVGQFLRRGSVAPSDITLIVLKATSPVAHLRSTKATFQLRRFLSDGQSEQVAHSYAVSEPWQWDVLSQEGLIFLTTSSGLTLTRSESYGIVAYPGSPVRVGQPEQLPSFELEIRASTRQMADKVFLLNGFREPEGETMLSPSVESEDSFYAVVYGKRGLVWRFRRL